MYTSRSAPELQGSGRPPRRPPAAADPQYDPRMPRVLALVALLSLIDLSAAPAHVEWAQFRGPNGSGVADGNEPPVVFGPSDKVLWKKALPPGHSSPIVWDDRVFVTAVDRGSLL